MSINITSLVDKIYILTYDICINGSWIEQIRTTKSLKNHQEMIHHFNVLSAIPGGGNARNFRKWIMEVKPNE